MMQLQKVFKCRYDGIQDYVENAGGHGAIYHMSICIYPCPKAGVFPSIILSYMHNTLS